MLEELPKTKKFKEAVFTEIIAPELKRRETFSDMAAEYLHLKELYGCYITQKQYATVKGISAVQLSKYVKEAADNE